MAFLNEDVSIKTLLGERCAIQGNLTASGYLRIDGDVHGSVETDGTLWIGEHARIKGNVSAKTAVVGGIIVGNVCAPAGIKLLSSSAVLGDIQTHRLQVEEQVVINGHCISLPDDSAYTDSVERRSAEALFKNKLHFEEDD